MTINQSGRRWYGNPNPPYDVHEGEGDPPNGYVLLAAPGAAVPADYVNRYGLADRLKATEGREPTIARSFTGEPLVHTESGRAVAASIAPDHLKSQAVRDAEVEHQTAQARKAAEFVARQKAGPPSKGDQSTEGPKQVTLGNPSLRQTPPTEGQAKPAEATTGGKK